MNKLYNKKFEKIQKIGEGSYGSVYKVLPFEEVNKKDEDKNYLALKKFNKRVFSEGMDFTALREITILKELNHENIVKIIDMFYGPNSNLFIAYEYLDFDISHVIHNKEVTLPENIIKGLLKQFLSGLYEIHKFNVIHRDLKPQNLLLKKNGILKIADFGFARFISSPVKEMTTGIISEWYRPPEIFFGAQYYSYSVDMWSVGCIFAEFLLKEPLFYGHGDKEILTKIFYLLGVPNEVIWPGAIQLDLYKVFNPGDVETIKSRFIHVSKEGIDLLEKLLVLDPNKRINCEEALNHIYFDVDPLPATPEEISHNININFKIINC